MSIENEVISRMLIKQLELECKGFTPEQACTATKRARKYAASIAHKVAPAYYEPTFIGLFRVTLDESESWLRSLRGSGTRWEEGVQAAAALSREI